MKGYPAPLMTTMIQGVTLARILKLWTPVHLLPMPGLSFSLKALPTEAHLAGIRWLQSYATLKSLTRCADG